MYDDERYQELSDFQERRVILAIALWEWFRGALYFMSALYGFDWVWDSFLHWAFPT